MAEGAEPTVGVVFGTYNRMPQLQRTMAALRRNAGLPFDVIAVDGGSSDGSREWLQDQPDVRLIRQEGPLTGAVAAFNLGFAYAVDHYPFICQLNDDAELVTSDGIARALAILRADPRAGAVAFAFDFWGDFGVDSVRGVTYVNFGVIRREAGMAVARKQGDPSGKTWWNPVYRTYGADCEFGCLLSCLGWKVHAAPDIRVHDLSTQDGLRDRNQGNTVDRPDTRLFWRRWRTWSPP